MSMFHSKTFAFGGARRWIVRYEQ